GAVRASPPTRSAPHRTGAPHGESARGRERTMSTGIWAAVSGATGQMAALDVAANNVANAGTPGFRADREVFAVALAGAMDGNGAESLRYNTLRSVQPDLSVGQIVHTGRELDVALTREEGLFVVRTADGDRYTRAG